MKTSDVSILSALVGPSFLAQAVLVFLGIVVFSMLIREIATWYWKINQIIKLLEKIEYNTRSKEKSD